MQSLNDNARVVRLPTNIVNRLAKLNKDLSRFELDNEREPMFNELSDGDFDEIPLLSYQKSVSLNQQINEDGDELIQLIENQDEAFEEVDLTERIKNEINKTMMILDDREKVIIENYFGLNPHVEPMTLEAIGEKYQLSKERIRQIKHKAIRKLRHNSFNLQLLINE
jgi:RNA polymerase primary sigma factor